jgi:ATP-binding cassette, subfamily B, bacterial MsbA
MKEFLRVMMRYVPPYRKYLWLNLACNFISAFFSAFSIITIIPLLRILFKIDTGTYVGIIPLHDAAGSLSELKDAVIHNVYSYISTLSLEKGELTALIYIGLFLIFMVFFKVGFAYTANYFIVFVRNSVIRDIRNQIYDKTVSLPIGFFTEEHKGDIISRITGDVQEVEASIMNSLDMLLKNPVIIMVSVIFMIIMSWQLTLFVFVLFPVVALVIGRIGKSLKRRSLEGQNKMGEILSTIEETLSGLRIIKAFNAEHKIKKRFHKETEDFRRMMNRILKRRYLAHPLSELMGTMVIVVVMCFGGFLILYQNKLGDAAQFLAYIGIFYSIINPAKSFSQDYYSVQKGLASIERIDRILNVESNIIEKKDAIAVTGFHDSIEYRDVSFRYKKDAVLRNISFTLKKGKTIALVGHSGSGKSTLADLLPRFYDVVEGQILLDGRDIRDLKINDLRALMGIVNQEPILFNDTFFNNIAFGVENAKADDVINAAKVAHAHDFIKATKDGYDTTIGDRGSKLSGGQRQRISIARAVLKNPPLLILDEATSALDTESEKLVQDALNRLMKNRTSIVIAHRLSTIVHADEIFVLADGAFIEHGNHEQLLAAKGEYYRFYNMQYFS